ncbi:F0F1 ATP synthase subunit gamma [Limosilactobacillus fastidiosus]|uniref:ATP synthase gamma chain n=1 Tax=Limosilactobacillus fastidiosus TaxID=2759855 RepID=A0A7W3TZ95_9LACO|nr:F0F1 ATP synthase subunit gamma [Limosilactobacillus fastidiosus]MBB1063025.1 F0F1 ATP synthase subunit gamma [Limosilactobacillus fastidiosus]MBB1085750.1 F0F1 ATP synthase subunit gamma [Limosilactobacillus fastidiosus]MCD7083894.1 F0F1 ATP synthase subunit gamma [Limosilactobacillus fastidiosus]MCD7086210.1 F0F1 ATP synthase subunit gamma [Limosilactobacillus fastidiosus]MCD7114064.1 F0F1 ATP synthase subunit gamma [Limosilactobacillus fastidiosus]
MPASLAAVKHKIESTKSTRQITSAMQMVSTAKLNQIQHHTQTYEVYAEKVKNMLSDLVKSHNASAASASHDAYAALFEKRPVKKTGILVITSDRGLVGSYNNNIIKQTLQLMTDKNLTAENTVFLTVGKTGTEFFKKRGMNVVYQYSGISDVPTFREVHQIVKTAVQMYDDAVFDEMYLVYSHYVNRITSRVRVHDVLPITAESLMDDEKKSAESNKDESPITAEYEFEPSDTEIIAELVSQYAESLLYGAILDAKTSEHSSSANAMRSATDNADDIISSLELQYNRARQAAITTEITEITGGMTAQE